MKRGKSCENTGLLRDEDAMKEAARMLALAGGYKYRHYIIKVDSGRAACIEEYEPYKPKKLVVD